MDPPFEADPTLLLADMGLRARLTTQGGSHKPWAMAAGEGGGVVSHSSWANGTPEPIRFQALGCDRPQDGCRQFSHSQTGPWASAVVTSAGLNSSMTGLS